MLAFITTEFQKLKRYSIILVGMLGVACSPIISIVMQKIMTDEAKNVLNYTFPDLLNSTIWNNMTMFFPKEALVKEKWKEVERIEQCEREDKGDRHKRTERCHERNVPDGR